MTKDEENELAFRLGRIAGRLTVIKDDVLPKLKWNEHGFFEYRAEIGILLDDCLKDTDILTPIFPKDAVKAELADEIESVRKSLSDSMCDLMKITARLAETPEQTDEETTNK